MYDFATTRLVPRWCRIIGIVLLWLLLFCIDHIRTITKVVIVLWSSSSWWLIIRRLTLQENINKSKLCASEFAAFINLIQTCNSKAWNVFFSGIYRIRSRFDVEISSGTSVYIFFILFSLTRVQTVWFVWVSTVSECAGMWALVNDCLRLVVWIKHKLVQK